MTNAYITKSLRFIFDKERNTVATEGEEKMH